VVKGLAQRNKFDENLDFEQPKIFWTKVMKEDNKVYLVKAMAGNMEKCRPDIKERMIKLCGRVHPEFGQRLAQSLKMPFEPAKM